MALRGFDRQVNAWLLVGALLATTTPAAPATREKDTGDLQEGSVGGDVILSPRISARRPRFRLYTEYGQNALPKAAADTNEMANVVIYLDSPDDPGGAVQPSPEAAQAEVSQENEAFSPHVLPVRVGTSVGFPNKDPFFHNVFSLSKPRSFDLGRYPPGASKSVRFDRVGVVQVFCHIHSDMSAIVFVLPNRFFTRPSSRGTFAIHGIPAGTYRLTAWHERAKPITASLRIEAGKTARIDFNIPIADVDSGKH